MVNLTAYRISRHKFTAGQRLYLTLDEKGQTSEEEGQVLTGALSTPSTPIPALVPVPVPPAARDPFGYLTITGPDFVEGTHGPLSFSYYRLSCICGNTVRRHRQIIEQQLRSKSKLIYSCGCEDSEHRRLYPTARVGRPKLDLSGMVFGRLEVISSAPIRHTCVCECGGIEYYHNAAEVRYAGSRKCHQQVSARPKTGVSAAYRAEQLRQQEAGAQHQLASTETDSE